MIKIIGMQALHRALSETVTEAVQRGPVVVTHYNKAVTVMLTLAEYERLTGQIFRYALESGEAGFEPQPEDRLV